MNCSREGCRYEVAWVLKGADKKLFSCGSHLNQIANRMIKFGLEYMTLSLNDE